MNEVSNIQKIDQYWRAANYLTVAFMYLKDNIFLKRKLRPSDLKEYPSGHWGTSPGINFIVAHLNSFVTRTQRRIQLVVGPGHAGNALFANLLLEGTLQEFYPIQSDQSESFDIDKIQDCIAQIRTEGSPYLPGTIYDGGELGYSLPVSFGSILDQPDLLTVCIVGDGEFETGTISSSWRCNRYIGRSSGKVLPIIHLNGYRMGDQSLLSGYSDNEIDLYFKSMGYIARFVHLDHQEMIDSLNWVDYQYKRIEAGMKDAWPVLIFKSPKGCTAPDIEGIQIQETLDAHKNPLRDLSKQEKVIYLQSWLDSYSPEELFNEKGYLKKDITEIIPENKQRIGRTLDRYEHRRLLLPPIEKFSISPTEKSTGYSNISILEKYLLQIMQDNSTCFRIVSPDELKSNLLGKLKNNSNRGQSDNQVMEILNENICQGWMQGYIMTGRNCLMISYESFMSIISSMISQFSKWLYQASKNVWRPHIASLTYILTSLWEENTYSHQNPEFINHLLSSQHDFIRIHMPIDANTLLACLHQCLSSEDQIHVIVVSKQSMPQILEIEDARECVEKRSVEWNFYNSSKKDADLVIVAAGDYPTRECKEGVKILQQYLPDINLKMVSILELTALGNKTLYAQAMSDKSFEHLFSNDIPVIFCFHGYPSIIKSLLFERIAHRKVHVMGYNNQSTKSTNGLNKMILNGVSRYHIVLQACQFLRDKLSEKKAHEIETRMKISIEKSLKGSTTHDKGH